MSGIILPFDVVSMGNQDTQVVCRAAQEVSLPHLEYINWKKESMIFTPM